jgi:hypothetical protein
LDLARQTFTANAAAFLALRLSHEWTFRAGRRRDAAVYGLEQDMIDKGVIKKRGEFIESFSASILLGFPSKPADLTGIAAFLASSDSDDLTGQVIMSDGGMVLV